MRTRFLAQSAIIAAAYAALSILLMGISYGPVQIRVAEALCVLPVFTPAAIPGLFVGCLISNIFSPSGLPDLIFGSLATLLAAASTYVLRKRPLFAFLPAVILNAIIVGLTLFYTTGTPLSRVLCILWVGVGQLISCYILGYPLYRILRLHTDIFAL